MTHEEIILFHGHECPSHVIGFKMAIAVMEELKALRSEDGEVVAIFENNACGVDAL